MENCQLEHQQQLSFEYFAKPSSIPVLFIVKSAKDPDDNIWRKSVRKMLPAVAKYGFLQLFGSIEEEMFIGTKLRTPLQIFISSFCIISKIFYEAKKSKLPLTRRIWAWIDYCVTVYLLIRFPQQYEWNLSAELELVESWPISVHCWHEGILYACPPVLRTL